MFVDQFLLAVTFQNNGIIIKSLDHTAELEPVDQEKCDWNSFFACLVEKYILQIKVFHLYPVLSV